MPKKNAFPKRLSVNMFFFFFFSWCEELFNNKAPFVEWNGSMDVAVKNL